MSTAFHQVQFLSPDDGWVLEDEFLLHTSDGGTTWTERNSGGVSIDSFAFLDESNGWAVGSMTSERAELESRTIILSTADGGKTWKRVYRGSKGRPVGASIAIRSSHEIWVAAGTLIITRDGGASWRELDIESIGGQGVASSMSFDGPFGWITTQWPHELYLTSDGGASWERREFHSARHRTGVAHFASGEVYRVDGYGVFRSGDSGLNWTRDLDGDYFRIKYFEKAGMLVAAGKTMAKLVFSRR